MIKYNGKANMIWRGIEMKRFFKIVCVCLAALMCVSLVACYKEPTGNAKYDHTTQNTGSGKKIFMKNVEKEIDSYNVSDFVASKQQSDYVLIKVKGYGDIVVLLRHDVAPVTVENFKKLTAEKFYDGTIFHRVIENFMIQGGGNIVNPDYDPQKGNATYIAKSSDSIKGEFSSNGFTNNLKHVRGVISMARVGASENASAAEKEKAYNSASSQFFIIHKTNESSVNLNGDYAAFGYVLAGMDVVDAIATCEVWGKGSEAPLPAIDIVIESITFVEPK